MNSEIRDKLRRLTMFYNSIDFAAMKPGTPPNSHLKRVEELEFLFFDKASPESMAEMYERLKENSITDLDAAISFNVTKKTTLERDFIPDFLQEGKFAENKAEAIALEEMSFKCCIINFDDSNADHAELTNKVIGPCFSTVGTNQILLPRNAETTDDPPVTEFGRLLFAQINSDITSPLKRDAELLDSYMNYIPNIERSKCTPFLKVRFLSRRNTQAKTVIDVKKGTWPWDPDETTITQGNIEQLAVFNFLNGSNSKAKPDTTDWLISQASKHDMPSGLSDARSITTHGMEMFTMPQSIQGKTTNPLTDPFRPLMSLDGATIHIYPAGEGFISFKKASLDFTLFDRTRLRDVSFLLDPARFGSTIIEVEAGWEHPDTSSVYGAILSAMRIKDVYGIQKADFAMKGSSTFNITVDAAMLGGPSIFHDNIFTSSAAAKQIKEWNKKNIELAGTYKEIATSLGKGFEINPGKILPESIVSKAGGKDAVAAFTVDIKELEELLTNLQNAVAERNADGDPATDDIAANIVRDIDTFLSGIDVDDDSISAVDTKIEQLKTDFKTMIMDPGDSLDPYLVSPFDGVVEVETAEGTDGIDRQVGLVPGAPGTNSIGALLLPGDSTWMYQWNTTESVSASPPPEEARPGNPPHPEMPETARPPRFPLYWWARRNAPYDDKVDTAGQDVWENLWTARFPTLNNAVAYQVLNDAFPIVPGTPPEEAVTPAETEYISFGKLFLNLVAYPTVNRSGGSISEAHVITYNFNKYAGGLGYKGPTTDTGEKRNIASFALKKEGIVKAMSKHLEKKYDIMPSDILNFARKEMSNRHNEQFGIIPVDDSGNHTDPVRNLKGEAEELKEQISILTKEKDGLQTTQSGEEYYIDSADLAERRRTLQDQITGFAALFDGLNEEFAEMVESGENSLKETMGVSKIKMPALKMLIETVKKDSKTIVRFHLYDSNEKPYEIHEIAANTAEILDISVNTADVSSEQLYKELQAIPGALTTIPSRREGTLPKTVLNHRSLAIKSAIKANMPSITYGTEATAINSISLNSISDTDMNTHFLLETRKKEKKDPSNDTGESEKPILADSAAEKIFPVTLTVDLLGCPIIEFAQQVFIDLGTSTDIDNIYGAIDIKHTLKPGSFKTVAKMSPTFSGNSVAFGDVINDIISNHDRIAAAAGAPEDES